MASHQGLPCLLTEVTDIVSPHINGEKVRALLSCIANRNEWKS